MSAPVYDASEWAPGDVAVICVPKSSAPEHPVSATGFCAITASRFSDGWAAITNPDYYWPDDYEHFGQESRRLTLIDPEDTECVNRLSALYYDNLSNGVPQTSAMQAALREFANPTPRIEEPQGLGAVVEDAEGADWHRTREGRWIAEDGLRTRAGGWGHINQPARLVTEGVTP